jgi:2-aminoadipate transaminase
MKYNVSKRIINSKRSFIREILKELETEIMISFSGGFPNPMTFPSKELEKISADIYKKDANRILQYSSTEGYQPLRIWIAKRYEDKYGMKIDPDGILIVNGSQQAFDLIAKTFLDPHDHMLMERPTYLGALQSFTLFEPHYHSANLLPTGIDLQQAQDILDNHPIKMVYAIPNFQNPSGISYDLATRKAYAELLKQHQVLLIEDDPYGDLRFEGEDLPPISSFMQEDSILLGSFSKIIAPGLRIGWIISSKEIIDKLIIAKEAADLQSNLYSQMLIHAYVSQYSLDQHIASIVERYGRQRNAMLEAMKKYFHPSVSYVIPEGGMFLWVTLPNKLSAMALFERAKKLKVVFVPGDAFYIDEEHVSTFRLNYTNSEPEEIHEGIKRLASAINDMI